MIQHLKDLAEWISATNHEHPSRVRIIVQRQGLMIDGHIPNDPMAKFNQMISWIEVEHLRDDVFVSLMQDRITYVRKVLEVSPERRVSA